ncbi:MFS transporter [Streptomyces sp. NBC_00690]|uniref:MFS transporter n=1 Tax=Streptomyces sp. NBC_00690 TaxID=2975808 RepID=UPI002E290675|nr:MFS transporter [Streptomyces sp. NBC_00690]
MPLSRAPVPARASVPVEVRRLERRLLAYAGLDDFVLLYPVYAVLFTDHGLSTAEISSLFVITSLTGLLVEVPSGVWADTVSRRRMLVIGPALASLGFALWVALPGYASFALGMVLWAGGGALRSGSMEALAYEELERLGAEQRYVRLMGRAAAASTTATALATAAAGPLFAWGGYSALGAASVLACVLCSAAALTLPEHRRSRTAAGATAHPAGPRTARSMLRSGLAEVRAGRGVRYALLMSVLLTSIWGALEEYVPLLAAEMGAATRDIPWFVLIVWVGVTLGGLLAERAEQLSQRVMGGLLALAALLLALGALAGALWGFLALAIAFLVFQLADVVADARLQGTITGPSRATVTSLAGWGTSCTTLIVYGVYGTASGQLANGPLFAFFAVPYLVVAAVLARRTARYEG